MFQDRDLHKSLKSEVLATSSVRWGANLALVKLQWGKDDVAYSLHVAPNTYTTSGIQVPDLLSYLGFSRQPCSFLSVGECYVKQVNEGFDLNQFGQAFGEAYKQLEAAEHFLSNCGYALNQPEGWGFFLGGPSGRRNQRTQYFGDGHTSAVTPEVQKQTEDEVFHFVFTWIKNNESDKGWTIHYLPKHLPLSLEIQSIFDFLNIKSFAECPQSDFEPCWWRHIQYEQTGDGFRNSNVDYAHRSFDAHQGNFTPGIKALLAAQETMERVGMGFLPHFEEPGVRRIKEINRRVVVPETTAVSKMNESFDVAISFAGSERKYAQSLATKVKAAGYKVFYDGFFPEDLWGKNLGEFFHDIYSKRSRFCVILVSKEYLNREWTIHERRSAQERMLKEKGGEYILPIKVDDIELPGLPSTIGYLPIDTGIDSIAQILIKKLAM